MIQNIPMRLRESVRLRRRYSLLPLLTRGAVPAAYTGKGLGRRGYAGECRGNIDQGAGENLGEYQGSGC